jgi:predicted transcriptional regulator
MKKAGTGVTEISSKEVAKVLKAEGSKSGKMKQLFDMGMDVKSIAELMQVRYNFVYNVVSNYANMNGMSLSTTKKTGKKDEIIALHLQGKTKKEISIDLKTNYNYVFNVLKQYAAEQEKAAKAE